MIRVKQRPFKTKGHLKIQIVSEIWFISLRSNNRGQTSEEAVKCNVKQERNSQRQQALERRGMGEDFLQQFCF